MPKPAPNRSKPEFSGRPLTIDEKKEDVTRLRDVVTKLETAYARLEGMNNAEAREEIQQDIDFLSTRIELMADNNVKEIRREIFKATGDDEKHVNGGGTYRGGKTNTGGLKL